MLTLKLMNTRTRRTTIVETPGVQVEARPGGGHTVNAGTDVYEVREGADYDRAYVENAQGATIQVINGTNR